MRSSTLEYLGEKGHRYNSRTEDLNKYSHTGLNGRSLADLLPVAHLIAVQSSYRVMRLLFVTDTRLSFLRCILRVEK